MAVNDQHDTLYTQGDRDMKDEMKSPEACYNEASRNLDSARAYLESTLLSGSKGNNHTGQLETVRSIYKQASICAKLSLRLQEHITKSVGINRAIFGFDVFVAQDYSRYPGDPRAIFEHKSVRDFYCGSIASDRDYYELGKSFNAVVHLLKILDVYGDYPSICSEPSNDKYAGHPLLAIVPLRDHTLNVAREIISYAPSNGHIRKDKLVLCALAHDLGKIALAMDQEEGSLVPAHAEKSAHIMSAVTRHAPSEFNEVLFAVRNHHERSKDPLTQRLRAADRSARNLEKRMVTGDPSSSGYWRLPRNSSKMSMDAGSGAMKISTAAEERAGSR